jgi:hypothetical protein
MKSAKKNAKPATPTSLPRRRGSLLIKVTFLFVKRGVSSALMFFLCAGDSIGRKGGAAINTNVRSFACPLPANPNCESSSHHTSLKVGKRGSAYSRTCGASPS